MIVVTGARGFIASVLIAKLKMPGIVAVDAFERPQKTRNLDGKDVQQVDRQNLFAWMREHRNEIRFVFHMGARTDTTETDTRLLRRLNTDYSKTLWTLCTTFQIPLVFASSAATYGSGELGFNDDESLLPRLRPLNSYALSKHNFDTWVLQQSHSPPFWAGLKFFNVYGPNEYHKGPMSSVIKKGFEQIQQLNYIRLFRSYQKGYADGEQLRDFVYVEDVAEVCLFMYQHQRQCGFYNVGSNKAASFNTVAHALFKAMNKTPDIRYIEMTASLKNQYQYFTEANIEKLRKTGYTKPFHQIEEGIGKYVNTYLMNDAVL